MADSRLMTISAHTMDHPILSNESDQDAKREIRESLEELSMALGEEAKYFSYPNGSRLDFGTREQKILRQENVKLSFTDEMGFFNNESDPLAIPRAGFSMSGGEDNRSILGKLLLVPVWDSMRTLARFGETEAKERQAIKVLAVL